jgi:hypothetical protein
MAHPLENYRVIVKPDFIFQMEQKFYSDHYAELSKGLYVEIEKDSDRMYVTGVDLEGNDFDGHITFSSYFLSEYNKLEKESRSEIDNALFTLLEEAKQQVFIRNIIAELQVLQVAMAKLSVEPRQEVYKAILLDKVNMFSEILTNIYLTSQKTGAPKIQWLGKTNILATLFYDLWQGQEKFKEPSTRSLIKAQKKDLEALLINNFLDEKGKPLTESTISDYLNSSKPEKRAKEDIRIELTY